MKIISACLISILLILNLNFAVRAHTAFSFPQASEEQIAEALQKTVPLRFLPSHPLYFLISIKETFTRIFKPSAAQRAEFDLILSGKRLKEAYLLLSSNNIKGSSKTLARYSKQVTKMSSQLEKARSQNQDIANLVGQIAEGLRNHQILFFAIETKWQTQEDSFHFDENLQAAFSSFEEAVLTLDRIKPGIKDRFKSIEQKEIENKQINLSPATPSGGPLESSPSRGPRRIIY